MSTWRPSLRRRRYLLADAQTSGGFLIAGEIPGAPVIAELVSREEHTLVVRLRGSAIGEKGRLAKAFRIGHSPDAVAKAVTGAVARNRAMVSVGIEAQIGYHALRLIPPLNSSAARV